MSNKVRGADYILGRICIYHALYRIWRFSVSFTGAWGRILSCTQNTIPSWAPHSIQKPSNTTFPASSITATSHFLSGFPIICHPRINAISGYATSKVENRISFCKALRICLVKVKVQWDEVNGRILMGENTCGGTVILRSIRFQYAGVRN
jgi:hypothetical protein